MSAVIVRYVRGICYGVVLLAWVLLGMGCSSNPRDPDKAGGGGGGGEDSSGIPSGFSIADDVHAHVAILAKQLLDRRSRSTNRLRRQGGPDELIAWAGKTLLPEDYQGAMRSTAGVLTGFMGNDLDRCRFVRELLSAADIPNRFAINEDSCKVEAWIAGEDGPQTGFAGGEAKRVPTSRFDEGPIPANWERTTSIPADSFHTIEIVERFRGTGFDLIQNPDESEASLGTWTLAELASAPVLVDYVAAEPGAGQGVEDSQGLRLRLRVGRRGDRQEWLGVTIGDVERHELVFRYTRPGADPVDHRRILFDRTSRLINQSPDVEDDVYAIWFGGNVVGDLYLQVENALARLGEDDADVGDVLYLRAIELAMETDSAAWQLFEKSELDGASFFDSARIVIAAQERRFDGHDGITPSFDLVRNTRRILSSSDPVAAQFALGYADAMVEGALLERTTGAVGVTVPEIFTGLFRDEADDVLSRADLFENALRRLEEEGVTEEALLFSDEVSGAQVEVALVGTELLLIGDGDNIDRLETLAGNSPGGGDKFDELTPSIDGVVLGDGADRSWPIDLLLLDQDAALNYTPRIEHRESPQLALATPTGAYLQGSGVYLGQSLQISAIARAFEEAEVEGDPDSKRDQSDWHFFDGTGEAGLQAGFAGGALIGSGSMEDDTPSLDEKNPRILQWGESPSTVSFYESPLWLAPAVAAGIRSSLPTKCRITTETGGAADWLSVTFTQFADARVTLSIDGQPVGVRTIVATDDEQAYEITIAKHGLTRLILGLRTPNGESSIESIITPRALRLRGRVMSYRKPLGFAGQPTYAVGVPDTNISSGGLIGTSWPDGSVDLRVPETVRPTLRGSIGILIDTSGSMDQPADPDCTGECTPKIDVVSLALADVIQETDDGLELAVWGFANTFDGSCDTEVRELAAWSLARSATQAADNSLTTAHLTGGTPLTGAVRGALNAMERGAWGVSRRLIVLADGDNDCDAGLDSINVPNDVEVHTVGVGLAPRSDAELQLMDLAARSGGTYTRTVTGSDLADALTSIAALPLAPPVADVVSTQINAEDHTSRSFEFPVDQDDVVIYLEEAPDRDIPAFVVVQPDEPFPGELVSVDEETIALIEEHRSQRPGVTIVMPDRLVSVGGWPNAFGWLEVDAQTGQTTAVTSDSLHGAGSVIYFGATVLGMWAGAEAVISNFSGCVLTPAGCGSDISEIRQTICATTGYGPAIGAVAISWLGTVFTSANGFALDQSYATGMSVVNKLCSTEFDLTGFVASTIDNANSAGLGEVEVAGGWLGFGYSVILTIWNNSGGGD